MAKESNKINMSYVINTYENFDFNQNFYKMELNGIKSKAENHPIALNSQLDSAINLNNYIENNLEKNKIRLANEYIRKNRLTFLPWIISLLILSLSFVIIVFALAINAYVNDILVGILTSLSLICLGTVAGLTFPYVKKYIRYTKDKIEYFRQPLTKDVSLLNITNLAFDSEENLKINGLSSSLSWASLIKENKDYDDYDYEVDPNSIEYDFYGAKVLVQNAKLTNKTDKKEKYIALFEIHLDNSKFGLLSNNFSIFKTPYFLNNTKLKEMKLDNQDLNNIFKPLAENTLQKEPMLKSLKSLNDNNNFMQKINVNEAIVSYLDNKIVGFYELKNINNDPFHKPLKQLDFNNKLKLQLPEKIDLSNELPLWFILDNFYPISKYAASLKSNFYELIAPLFVSFGYYLGQNKFDINPQYTEMLVFN
ncbi:hypothetical protein [Mycoplasmopsis primatum]|uniref:hypothetical protein n=1 Tax=Mycoplasmopsis primatum TaxID=55604 RepID=UPI0004970678|nr:hypothetical protein [Mycoplasmopsis primatum]